MVQNKYNNRGQIHYGVVVVVVVVVGVVGVVQNVSIRVRCLLLNNRSHVFLSMLPTMTSSLI